MRYVLSGLMVVVACTPSREKRAAQFDACETAYRDGQRITECLIMKYDWEPTTASIAGGSWGLWEIGKGRHPRSWIGPPREPAVEMRSILRDFAMGQEAYFQEHGRYASDAQEIRWVSDLDSVYHLKVEYRVRNGWGATLTRDSLQCATFVGGRLLAPATREFEPVCAALGPS